MRLVVLRHKAISTLLVVGVGLLCVVLVVPSAKDFLRFREPFRTPYLWYFNLRYPWKTSAEAGDGKPALQISLEDPVGLAEDDDGNVYISDRGRFIWRIDSGGTAHVIAGSGKMGASRSCPVATEMGLGSPEGLCLDDDGSVYFTDSRNNVVLKIEMGGRLIRVAGSGVRGFSGDGGPALDARLCAPFDVRADASGNLFIADICNQRVRKVDRSGIITTVAGTGVKGYSGDGRDAVHADLRMPYGVALDLNGDLIIIDSENHVIRRVGADGRIMTIAGTGVQGYSGDGGPALEATFDTPQHVLFDRAGRMFINDEHNHCIRVVEIDGSISTLIGVGRPGYAGDGVPAAGAQLNDPESVWVRKDGSVLIADGDNRQVRVIDADGTLNTFAGRRTRGK